MAALSDTSSEEGSEQSFEMDQTHCLNLFNILKHEPTENLSPFKQNSSPNKKASYYHNQGQFQFFSNHERTAYFHSVANINSSLKEHPLSPTKISSKENSNTSTVQHAAPRTLKDIFRISNTNRKKNKLRKKTNKLDVGKYSSKDEAAPPANISALI
jgi:hypothetical protein